MENKCARYELEPKSKLKTRRRGNWKWEREDEGQEGGQRGKDERKKQNERSTGFHGEGEKAENGLVGKKVQKVLVGKAGEDVAEVSCEKVPRKAADRDLARMEHKVQCPKGVTSDVVAKMQLTEARCLAGVVRWITEGGNKGAESIKDAESIEEDEKAEQPMKERVPSGETGIVGDEGETMTTPDLKYAKSRRAGDAKRRYKIETALGPPKGPQ